MNKYEQALSSLKTNGPFYSNCGICRNAKEFLVRAGATCIEGIAFSGWLDEQFPYWPEYSGDVGFPVAYAGEDSEMAYYRGDGLWDTTINPRTSKDSREYAAARWRLLDWLIERASEQGV